MKTTVSLLATVIAVAVVMQVGDSVQASTIYSTGFESPDFHTGVLSGQDGWSQSGGFGTGDTKPFVQNTDVCTGLQAITLTSGNSTATEARRVGDVLTGIVTMSFDIKIFEGTTAGLSANLNVTASESSTSIWYPIIITFSTNGNILAQNGNSVTDSGVAWSSSSWQNITMVADTETRTYDLIIDGTTVLSDLGFRGSTVSTISMIDFYMPMAGERNEGMYVDNVSLIPEPATIGLLGIGGLMTLLRNKR